MLKSLLKITFVSLLFFFLTRPVSAIQETINIYFFWGRGCPHCARERVFLENLEKKYKQVEVLDFEVTGNRENTELLQKIGKELNVDISGIPFTVIGKQYFVGYNGEFTGREIEKAVGCAIRDGCPDLIGSLITPVTPASHPRETSGIPPTINLPILGKVETKNLSLPALTFIIALLDGFNPCAMWALLFLISLLLGMRERARMWILGTAFIAASGLVYFLFIAAWLNFFLFLGFVLWVRLIIGLVAFAAGGYNLREYFVNKEMACKVTGGGRRRKIFEKLKEVTYQKEFILAFLGVILLAFAVNLVELVCSAGLPAVYTQILTLTKLPTWQYYLYLIFYIFIFMLDDLFVFFVAMRTLQAIGIDSKYARFSRLIGGSLMLLIGILLIFKPEVLMFG